MPPDAANSNRPQKATGNKPTRHNHGTPTSVIYMRLNVTTIKNRLIMEPTKLMWIFIVFVSAAAMAVYLIHTASHGHRVRHHGVPFISFDHSEPFCDDDDCDDE